jgi:alanine dehydrogenase
VAVLVGVPKETKDGEFRVGLTPAGAAELVRRGHRVRVQSGAGSRIGFTDADYAAAGVQLVAGAQEAFDADLVVKVKELQPAEHGLPRRGQILFAYLHLAPDPDLLDALLASGASGIAYETVADARGRLPLLEPMSRIAGPLAVQMGAWALTLDNGGSGVLLAGVAGLEPARVVVLGAGAAGAGAVRTAAGIGAGVTAFDVDPERLAAIDKEHGTRVCTLITEAAALEAHVRAADLVIGAVLVPGKLSPKLIPRRLIAGMRPGSVLVDIGIDQGGIAETSRPTSHSQPLYVEEGVVHYCVPNMPAACARSATLALAAATLPYVVRLADGGLRALEEDKGFAAGLQVDAGRVTHAGLAQDTGRAFQPFA